MKVRAPSRDGAYFDVQKLIHGLSLHTICEEARCPNISECWGRGTATFQILGDTCTRACGFCAIKTGRPTWFDDDEPRRVAEAVASLGLEHCVVTSVARDDLPDGGAHAFAETIREALGREPGRPRGYEDFERLPQRFETLPADAEAGKQYPAAHAA